MPPVGPGPKHSRGGKCRWLLGSKMFYRTPASLLLCGTGPPRWSVCNRPATPSCGHQVSEQQYMRKSNTFKNWGREPPSAFDGDGQGWMAKCGRGNLSLGCDLKCCSQEDPAFLQTLPPEFYSQGGGNGVTRWGQNQPQCGSSRGWANQWRRNIIQIRGAKPWLLLFIEGVAK